MKDELASVREALEYGQQARPRSPLFPKALSSLSKIEEGMGPVAMIHDDYDASVRCSYCGDRGGFGCYDDLEWARCCPGCGRPISEQVSAEGIRTPHPLYLPTPPDTHQS